MVVAAITSGSLLNQITTMRVGASAGEDHKALSACLHFDSIKWLPGRPQWEPKQAYITTSRPAKEARNALPQEMLGGRHAGSHYFEGF